MKKVTVRAVPKSIADIEITTDFIRLDAFLKFANLIETGGMAKALIQDGQALVNGEQCLMRGKKLRDGDIVSFGGETLRVKYADKEAEA